MAVNYVQQVFELRRCLSHGQLKISKIKQHPKVKCATAMPGSGPLTKNSAALILWSANFWFGRVNWLDKPNISLALSYHWNLILYRRIMETACTKDVRILYNTIGARNFMATYHMDCFSSISSSQSLVFGMIWFWINLPMRSIFNCVCTKTVYYLP